MGQAPSKAFSKPMELMDAVLVEARTEATQQVSKKLPEDMRSTIASVMRRLRRDAAENPVNAALLDTLKSDSDLATRFVLPHIADQHLHRRLYVRMAPLRRHVSNLLPCPQCRRQRTITRNPRTYRTTDCLSCQSDSQLYGVSKC